MNATVCLNDGDTHNAPVEATEAKNPIIVEHRALRQDSGGAGKFRGGLGVSNEVRMRRAGDDPCPCRAHDLCALGTARRQGRAGEPHFYHAR